MEENFPHTKRRKRLPQHRRRYILSSNHLAEQLSWPTGALLHPSLLISHIRCKLILLQALWPRHTQFILQLSQTHFAFIEMLTKRTKRLRCAGAKILPSRRCEDTPEKESHQETYSFAIYHSAWHSSDPFGRPLQGQESGLPQAAAFRTSPHHRALQGQRGMSPFLRQRRNWSRT